MFRRAKYSTITIPISAGTGIYTETINVNSTAEDKAPSQQVLRSNELQQLRGVITNDPMRAIHVLPGVATGDDLRSEFSVRGLPVRNMNFTFEGISTPLLVHTVQGVQDNGSIAMVNGDVLTEIGLAAGSYPQRHGNHTGAELNFLMREGSRDRVRGLIRPSMTDTSVVLEGPTGSSKTGSWLVSIRKSYLGTIIKRIDPDNTFAFGFHDAQVKLVQDLNAAHQVQFAFTAGRSQLDQEPEFIGMANVQSGVNDAAVAVVTWRYLASPRLILTQKLAAATNNFRNLNVNGLELDSGRRSEAIYRADWTYSRSSRVMFEGGGELRRSIQSRSEQGLEILQPVFALRESFSASAGTGVIVRDGENHQGTIGDCSRNSGRSLHAHQRHLGFAVDSDSMAAIVITAHARRRRSLSPGTRNRRSERLARLGPRRRRVLIMRTSVSRARSPLPWRGRSPSTTGRIATIPRFRTPTFARPEAGCSSARLPVSTRTRWMATRGAWGFSCSGAARTGCRDGCRTTSRRRNTAWRSTIRRSYRLS